MSGSRPTRSESGKPSGRKKVAAVSTKTDTSRADSPAEQDHNATVSLYGDMHGGMTMIRASNVRLVLTFGELADGRDVLVPLVDWQIYGRPLSAGSEVGPDDKDPLLSSTMLSLDNLAYLLQDLSYDTRAAVRLLHAQSKAGIPLVEERTRYMERMLRLASANLASAAEDMSELISGDEADAEDGSDVVAREHHDANTDPGTTS